METKLCKVALTALDKAMEVERQGKAFYEQAAVRVQDQMGKAVFQTLARDEVEHLRLLQAEHEAIENEQEWMELDAAKVCEPQGPLKVYPDETSAPMVIPEDASDLDALQMAMRFERDGYDAYIRAAEETDDSRGKSVYQFLAKQENSHYVFLQKTYDYLASEGAWYFDEEEFPMFDGA
jgi:rubrerythrin